MILRLSLLGILLMLPIQNAFSAEWKAGAASIPITPDQPMWMAGYGARASPAEGKRTDLYARALVLEDGEGNRGLILSMDVVGIDRTFAKTLTEQLRETHGFSRDQVALCTSHTHSGPVVGKNLGPLHYLVVGGDQQQLIDAYEVALQAKLLKVTGDAVTNLAPARLQHGSGKCTFAVNRRENKPYDQVPDARSKGTLKGPVDHDVPVLSVRDLDGSLNAVLFGYACHATVLSTLVWDGDYPGYAQTALEQANPGAVALFWAGCGGDLNPLPRRDVELAIEYGEDLAARVSDVLDAPMEELKPQLSTTFREIPLPLQSSPTAEKLAADAKSSNRFEVAHAKELQRRLQEEGEIANTYPFPIGAWEIGGEIDFIFLGGEVVIDYALRLKRERRGSKTWVAANANDVMAYIPSKRVLLEGGYEGGTSNTYYGLPALWDESVEEVIVKALAD
ncbi:MAG: neutral/alkaline non-lysosomal ceramidase N-terminal domain-containing protein [Verrucomicrobiota bacterium]